MRIAHLLCHDGITAELWLGALIDAGAPVELLQAPIDRCALPVKLLAERCEAREVMATRVRFEPGADAPRVESPSAVVAYIEAAGLTERAHRRAMSFIAALGRAEAAVHGVPTEAVRFHELGRPQGVARILASAAALEALDIDQVTASHVSLGSGQIDMAHGRFPVPAPAVLHLLTGFNVRGDAREQELTTPSGAAVLAAFAEASDHIPAMVLDRHGRGAVGPVGREQLLTVMIGPASAEPDPRT